jgi:hypothetical protein
MKAAALLLLLLAAAGCKKEEAGEPPAPATTASAPTAAAPTAPVPAPPDAAPALPSLGPPPAGMDPVNAAACDKGDAAACLAAARSIEPTGAWRSGISQEQAEALAGNVVRYARRACDRGSGDGCVLAARFTLKSGPEKAAALERGCQLGAMPACGDLGWSLLTTGNSRENKQRGLVLMEKACRAFIDKNDDEPGFFCNQTASFFASTDKPLRDRGKAKEMKALSCRQGYMIDCPCKQDTDCGGGDWFCVDDKCALPSPD